MSDKKKNVFWGLIAQYVYTITLMLLQIFIAPLLIRQGGGEALGGYAAIAQFTGYLTLLDLGFSSTLQRYLTQAYTKNDEKRSFVNFFAIGRWYLLIVSSVMFVIILGLSFVIPASIKLNPKLQNDAQWAMIILSVWYGSRFYFQMFSVALYASQNMKLVNMASTIGVVVRFIFTLVFILLKMEITGIVLANVIGDLTQYLLHMFFFFHKNPGIKLSWKILDRSVFKEFYKFGLNTFLINVSARIITSSTTFITGLLLGAVMASHYYTMYTPVSLLNTLILVIMYNIIPGMNEMYANGDIESLKNTYIKTLKFKLTILFAVFWGLILFHQYIVVLWVGKQQYEGFDFTILLSIYVVILTVSNFNENVLIVLGNIKWYAKLQIVVTTLGLIITIIAGHYFHLIGIVAGNLLTLIPVAVYSFGQLFKILNIDLFLSKWWPNVKYIIIVTIISVGLFIAQRKLYIQTNLFYLLLTAFVFALLIVFVGIDKEQRNGFVKMLKK